MNITFVINIKLIYGILFKDTVNYFFFLNVHPFMDSSMKVT